MNNFVDQTEIQIMDENDEEWVKAWIKAVGGCKC